MVLITWCQKPCTASDLMNTSISAINFWTVQKEHLIFYLECGSPDKRSGRNWSLWGCDFALTLVAWEAGSGIFIKLILSYIISVLNISNKLATGMGIQILSRKPVWVTFLPAVNIFISNYSVTYCHAWKPFWVRVHTLCLYRGIYFLGISLYCVPRSQWRKLSIEEWNPVTTPLWRFPCKNTQRGGQGLGVDERQVLGLGPSQFHQLLHPRGICSLSVSSCRLRSLRKPVPLVPYSSVINGYIFVAACPDQVYKGEKNFWNDKPGLWAWEEKEEW